MSSTAEGFRCCEAGTAEKRGHSAAGRWAAFLMKPINLTKSLLRETERAAKGELQFSKNFCRVDGIRLRHLSPFGRLDRCAFHCCATVRFRSARAIEESSHVRKKYHGHELYIAFAVGETWYLYPHDELLSQVLDVTNVGGSESWEKGSYSWPRLSKQLQKMLAPYLLPATLVRCRIAVQRLVVGSGGNVFHNLIGPSEG